MRPSEFAARLHNLCIELGDGRRVVDNVSLNLEAGEVVALVGESGSGKTSVAMALLGHVRRGARIVAGHAEIAGQSLSGCSERQLRDVRGSRIALVPQDPAAALNPSLSIAVQLREVLHEHRHALAADVDPERRLQVTLEEVGLPADAAFLARYPHQLSGGQQQRVLIAMAMLLHPAVLILDEPTTGLDVVTQAQVLATLRSLTEAHAIATLYVSHDLAVVAQVADRVLVMKAGQIVEQATTRALFEAPRHPYSQALLAAVPRLPVEPGASVAPAVVPLLEARHISLDHGKQRVLSDICLTLGRGECVGLVGASGSGKTSLVRSLVGLLPGHAGAWWLAGERLADLVERRSQAQRRRIQFIFQSPFASLNPRLTIGSSLRSAHAAAFGVRADVEQVIAASLAAVELSTEVLDKLPRQLSGGERQRVCIARALLAEPEVLVCDEITSALDVSIQAAIVRLLARLRRERNLAVVFVSHDLALLSQLSDRLLVLQHGSLVEQGATGKLLTHPEHPYTQTLLRHTPRLDSNANRRPEIVLP